MTTSNKKLIKICLASVVCAMLPLVAAVSRADDAATPRALNIKAADRAKVLQTSLIERLEGGEDAVDVIVLLKGYKDYVGRINADEPAEMKKAQAEIRSKQASVLGRLHSRHLTLKHQFDNIMGFAGRISREGMETLAAMPEIEFIEEDVVMETQDVQGIDVMNGTRLPLPHDGGGVSIAIVDTGIDYTHPMLGGTSFPNAKVIGGYDFGDNDSDPKDCHSHGTRVAGIAAGTKTSGQGDYTGGVARNARLYALKVSPSCQDSTSSSTIAMAWDWVVTHKYDDPANPILIINTSFGERRGRYTAVCDDQQRELALAADNAAANGILIFSSAGNDGYKDGITSPACLANSVSVGAVYDANIGARYWVPCTDYSTARDQVTCYSNSAAILEILASSNDAYTTDVGGGYDPDFGGTSAASPYAAGTAALIQSTIKRDTGQFLSPSSLRTRLKVSGDPILDPSNGISKPRVNVLAAYEKSLFNPPCGHPRVRIAGPQPRYFSTLQAAYNAANNGETIQSLYGAYPENLTLNRNISITFSGGFDCNFIPKLLGNTTVSGAVATPVGNITMKNFAVY
jgi:hypothetical protein